MKTTMEAFVQKERWSKTSILTTALCFAVVIFVAWFAFVRSLEFGGLTAAGFAAAIIIPVAALALFFTPRWLSVDDYCVTISFPMRRLAFELRDIEGAECCKSASGFVRTCGCGGFFGYWGWHYSRELGKFLLYATELEHLVIIRLKNGKKYVVSSPDPERMVEEIGKRKKTIR